MADALSVRGLTAAYGRAQALRDISLSVGHGEGVGVVGHNGAGKTTLLRAIARVHRQARGEIEFVGTSVMKQPAFGVARMGMSFVREGAPVVADLDVAGNLALAAGLARHRRTTPMELPEVYAVFPVLEELAGRRAGLLSGGQRQMLALASAVVSRPTLLLLDEPSAGLAPEVCESVFAAIRGLCQRGMAVLIAEQNRDWLDGVAERSVVLQTGRLVGTA